MMHVRLGEAQDPCMRAEKMRTLQQLASLHQSIMHPSRRQDPPEQRMRCDTSLELPCSPQVVQGDTDEVVELWSRRA